MEVRGRSCPTDYRYQPEVLAQLIRLAQIAGIVGTVVTFVITGIITRLILVRFGLETSRRPAVRRPRRGG